MKKNQGISRVFSYVFKYKGIFILTILFSLVYVVGQVGGILNISDFFNKTLIGKDFEYVNWKTILIFIAFGVAWAGAHYIAFLASNNLSAHVIHDIRQQIYAKLLSFPLPYYKKNESGEILSRILNDLSVIEIFLMNIVVHIIAQPITIIVIVIIMFTMNPRISLYFFSIVPVIGLVLGGLGALVQNLSEKVQKNISNITSNIQETVLGIEVIKGYGVEETSEQNFLEANDKHLKANKKELKIRLLGTPASEFMGIIGIIIILALGAMSIKAGIATSADITSFILLALVLSQPLSQLGNITMVLKKLTPAANRIFEIIDSEEKENSHLPDIARIKGNLNFQDIAFSYDSSRSILENVNLKVKEGQTVAIVGPSGAGKSTLVSFIPAFNHPTSGKLLIDDTDTLTVNPLSIRKQISLVTQESILFSGSIKDNIKLSKPEATDEEIIEAAKVANAHQFITETPEGYDTAVGEKGVKLSGGQRQRIVLARAILRKPRILILDEATSSLDAESEKMINKAMKNILGQQTIVIITHKLSTIANADLIVVIQDGTITETGTHDELIGINGIYNRLYQIQIDI